MTGPAVQRRESGFSVIELMTAVMLMTMLGTLIGSVLVSSTRATRSLEIQTENIDAARVAMLRLEREFRSTECVREPLSASPGDSASGPVLRFVTRADGGSTEVTYRVDDGRLFREVDGESTEIAANVVSGTGTFTYAETPRRSIVVDLVIEMDERHPRQITTTVAGRNAWQNC